MIHRHAIKQYLEQERESFHWIKKLKEPKVDKALAELGFQSEHYDSLMLHQKQCVLAGIAIPNLCYWLEMGTGKSRVMLELFNYYYQTDTLVGKTLILAPTDEVVQSWENEIKKWGVNIPYVTLIGSTEQKWEQLTIDRGLVFATYIGLSYMVSSLVPKKKKKKEGNELVIVKPKLDKLLRGIEAVVLDESTKVSSPQSLSFKVCSQVSRVCRIRYALAGRPFGRDPIQLWAQFFLVDRGETLSPTIGFYREVFFNKKPNFWAHNAVDYVFNQKMKPELTRITAHRSLTYSVDECVTLPELVRIKKQVYFPEETLAYYQRLVDEIIVAKGDISLIKNVFIRMRQLSSGFLGVKDDETGERAEIEFGSNPKLDLLLELIDEMPEERKAVVFYEFTHSGRKISEALKKAKIKAGWLWSQTKDWKSMEYKFNNDPKYRVLVINSKKGAYGLNLQAANYVLYYESPISGIDRDQSEKRCHRTGQARTCFIYDLVTIGSMDERILRYMQEGKNLFQALVVDPAKVIGEDGHASA